MNDQSKCLDRRRFLNYGATLAVAGLVTSPRLFGFEEKADDPFGGFTLGVQSYTFREFDVEQALKRIKGLGLHYVELYQKHAPLESTPEQIKAILILCKDYEITPLCWGVQQFKADEKYDRKIFEFGKELGLKAFSANPDPDSFDTLDKLCEEYKIAIAIHPHGPVGGNKLDRWYSSEVILKAVKDHHPLIGTCLDTGHLIRCAQLGKKLDPVEEIKAMGARNFGIHLKDHDNENRTDVIYGKGVLDVPGVLKALREVKFKGMISIEYEANPKEPTEDVRACVQVVKEAVKKLS
jgi:sugar phosphate isomerase/epimerase